MSESSNQNEVHMTTHELIAAHGYTPETHHVWTEDGYCLEVHRVLPSDYYRRSKKITRSISAKNNNSCSISEEYSIKSQLEIIKSRRYPVIVHHGLLSSSADWLLLGPQRALAYVLCDNGYDVWLANARGNTYCQKHKKYTNKDREFWDFSWHEIGYYDLPAIIDYVLNKSGYPNVYYIGYSQGTSVFYVMESERTEYINKVKGMISLAPIAFLYNHKSPLLKLAVHFYNVMEWGSTYWNIHQWFPHNKLQARALGTLIRNAPGPVTKGVCSIWFYLIAGFGSNQLEENMLPTIFGHFPAGASAKQIIHYGQNILSCSFSKFCYGANKNLKIYGSTRPPKYHLEKVKTPIIIFYSENDFLTQYLDVQNLARKLPNIVEINKIEYSKFNHIDYLWGRDAKTLLYNKIVASLNKF